MGDSDYIEEGKWKMENWISTCTWGSSWVRMPLFLDVSLAGEIRFFSATVENSWCSEVTYESNYSALCFLPPRTQSSWTLQGWVLRFFKSGLEIKLLAWILIFQMKKISNQVFGLIWINRVMFVFWIEKITGLGCKFVLSVLSLLECCDI